MGAPTVDSIYYSFNYQWLIESVTVAVTVMVSRLIKHVNDQLLACYTRHTAIALP